MNERSLAPWNNARAARIPGADLVALAGLRDRADVEVAQGVEDTWIRWAAPEAPVIRVLLTVPAALFFEERSGVWYPLGKKLPTLLTPPGLGWRRLDSALRPEPVQGLAAAPWDLTPLAWKLTPGGDPRAPTALRCSLSDLWSWAQNATSGSFTGLQGALLGGMALVRGPRLPPLGGLARYHGNRVLIPLGFRGEPELTEDQLLEIAQVKGDGVLVCDGSDLEWIPDDAFAPLSRAAIGQAFHFWERSAHP